MILCAAGDIHGALDRMFTDISAFEIALSVRFDWVLHIGDLGVLSANSYVLDSPTICRPGTG